MSFFQSEAYYNLMSGLRGYKPFVFPPGQQEQDTDFLVGVGQRSLHFPKNLFSSRVLITGEPAFAEAGLPQTARDWQFRSQPGSRPIFTEIRLFEPPKNEAFTAHVKEAVMLPYLNILVDTSQTTEALYEKLSDSKKRQVQSSLSAGAIVRPAESETEVKTFYSIAAHFYKHTVKKPLLPEEVFLRIYRDSTKGVVLVVIHDGRVLGGMLAPLLLHEEMYEWYIACLDAEVKADRVYPSVLLTWEALRYASEQGIRRFNFMGAGRQDKPYGPRDFKLQFGGALVSSPRYYFIHRPLLFRLGKLAIRLGLGG